ncbi:MAG: ABC transporter substrate-binding protein [Myxococcota bacterium]
MSLSCLALAASLGLHGTAAEERLVTLGGAVTDIVAHLGQGEKIVGIDSTSTTVELPGEPKELGFFRRVAPSGVLSLRPTHVLAVDETGPKELFDLLAKAKVKVTRVGSPTSVDGAQARIMKIAQALGVEAKGKALVAKMQASLDAVQRPASKPKVLFVYARGPGTLLVAGRDTGPESLVRLAGGEFAVSAFEGFKPFSSEAVLESAPDVLLMTTNGLSSMGGQDGIRKHPVLSKTPAVPAGRIVAIDDLRLLGFGPDLGEAVKELAEKLDPS